MVVRLLFTLLVIVASNSAFAASTQDEAVIASKAWLRMVDDGDYAAAWADVAKLFKDRVDQDAWVKQVSEPRAVVGALQSRVFKSFVETTSLPDVPDGQYAIVIFDSTFANRKTSGEMVPLVLENGRWKVGGYYIK